MMINNITKYGRTQTIGFKLATTYFVIVLLLMIQGGFAIYSSRQVVARQRETLTNEIRVIAFQNTLSQLRVRIFEFLGTTDPKQLDRLQVEINERLHTMKTELAMLELEPDAIEKSLETYQKIIALQWDFATTQAYQVMHDQSETEYADVSERLATLASSIDEAFQQTVRDTDKRFIMVTSGLCGAGILIALALGLLVTRSILRQVGGEPIVVVGIVRRIAQGDMSMEFGTEHERLAGILAAMRDMTMRLREIVGDVRRAIRNVTTGSQHMNFSATQMSEGAAAQASATEEVSSSMEEMVANIQQNAENAQQTETLAIKAADDAEQSGQTVAETVCAIRKIADKVAIIDDITRQTRMLSLNATIEASRAGEEGRGFAVVAAEVRALATRSQAATEEISELAQSSVTIAERAGAMLRQLVPNIRKTAELVQEISAASREQNTTAAQISHAIQQLDRVTQQNSATSEELAANAEEFALQATHLQNAIAFFTLPEDGSGMAEGRVSAKEVIADIANGNAT